MKPESADSSMSKRTRVRTPGFEGLMLHLYFFTLPLPSITNMVSDATDGLVCRFPIGLLARFALEQEIYSSASTALDECIIRVI